MNTLRNEKTELKNNLSAPKQYAEATGNTIAPYSARVIWKKSYAVANGKRPTAHWRCDLTAQEYPALVKPISHELYPLWIKYKMYEHNIYMVEFYNNLLPGPARNQLVFMQRNGIAPVVNLLEDYMELATGNSWKKLVNQKLK